MSRVCSCVQTGSGMPYPETEPGSIITSAGRGLDCRSQTKTGTEGSRKKHRESKALRADVFFHSGSSRAPENLPKPHRLGLGCRRSNGAPSKTGSR